MNTTYSTVCTTLSIIVTPSAKVFQPTQSIGNILNLFMYIANCHIGMIIVIELLEMYMLKIKVCLMACNNAKKIQVVYIIIVNPVL